MTAATPTRPKTDRDENFPVASFALSRAKRGPVLAFYRFVRAADDVADAALLPPAEKLARLDAMEQALVAGDAALPEAAALHAVAAHDGAGLAEARHLLDAIRQEAVKARYADLAELNGYCARYADFFRRYMADAPTAAVWDEANVERAIAAWGRSPGREEVARRTAWRDKRLTALKAHKRSQPDS